MFNIKFTLEILKNATLKRRRKKVKKKTELPDNNCLNNFLIERTTFIFLKLGRPTMEIKHTHLLLFHLAGKNCQSCWMEIYLYMQYFCSAGIVNGTHREKQPSRQHIFSLKGEGEKEVERFSKERNFARN